MDALVDPRVACGMRLASGLLSIVDSHTYAAELALGGVPPEAGRVTWQYVHELQWRGKR
jgi:hypothetical protein